MDKEKFRRDILTMQNARRRNKIRAARDEYNEAYCFRRDRVNEFQCSEWRKGRSLMK
jgi:hypothetical protein